MTNSNDLIELLEFWFTCRDNWFDSSLEFDKNIKYKYEQLLIDFTFDTISDQILSDISDNYQKSIGLILLHDQIIRHIYRDNTDKIQI